MTKLWAICRNTFVQTIRQPIYSVLILVTFAVLVLSLPLAGWTMGTSYHETDQKMLINLGLGTLLIGGLFISAFSASSVLAREIDDKTALTVIAKPVPRALFVLGKFLGVAAAVAVAFYLCSLVYLMTVRHQVMPAAGDPYDWPVIVLGIGTFGLVLLVALAGNLMFNWTFTSAWVWSALVLFTLTMGLLTIVGKGWAIIPFGEGLSPQVVLALVLTFMAVLIFVAVAIAASTRLSQVMTLLVCFAVFVLGSMHPYLFGGWEDVSAAPRVLGWPLPNMVFFILVQGALLRDVPVPAAFAWLAAAYCAVYVTAVLAVGMALFQRRALEASTSSATLPGAVGLLAWAGRAGAVVAALAAVVLATLPRFHNLAGAALAAGLLLGGAAAWGLFGRFGRGRPWSYWAVLLLAVGVLAACVVGLQVPAAEAILLGQGPVLALVEAAIAAAVIIVLVLPKTRRHFTSAAR